MEHLPPDFDPEEYLLINSDVAESKCDPIHHYLRYGKKEGRAYRRVAQGADRQIVFSSKHTEKIIDPPIADIDADPSFAPIFNASRHFTMTPKSRIFALYEACKYVAHAGIEGDFVECGVWRGGSSIAAALTFERFDTKPREFYLYDTYSGMSEPTVKDVDVGGTQASEYIAKFGDDGKWAYSSEEEVQRNFATAGVRGGIRRFIKGRVEDTIPREAPGKICICRLDTDWYESTLHELEHLYPRLTPGGVLIIDDYGHWKGARDATDLYFSTRPRPLMVRIDESARMLVKR